MQIPTWPFPFNVSARNKLLNDLLNLAIIVIIIIVIIILLLWPFMLFTGSVIGHKGTWISAGRECAHYHTYPCRTSTVIHIHSQWLIPTLFQHLLHRLYIHHYHCPHHCHRHCHHAFTVLVRICKLTLTQCQCMQMQWQNCIKLKANHFSLTPFKVPRSCSMYSWVSLLTEITACCLSTLLDWYRSRRTYKWICDNLLFIDATDCV